jgi:adenine phosphoribosyltransferase
MAPPKEGEKERRSRDPKSSVRAPPKKAGGGGKFTLGRPGDEGAAAGEHGPGEMRTDPEDGEAYTFDELLEYYRGKYKKKALEEYWENECIPLRKKKPKKKPAAKAEASASPAPPEPVPKAKAKAKTQAKKLSAEDFETDGPLAKEIAPVIPFFPFKHIEKFYDIQGLLKHPKLLNAACALMAKRFRKLGATKVAGFEARGFLFTPVAIKMGVPFVMLRKSGKMPNTISSAPYTKEYAGVDSICIQKDIIAPGDKVVLLDDLVATGGTLCAGVELIKACEAEVVECACLVELKSLKGRERVTKAGAKAVWALMTEELLTTAAALPTGYVDDGEAH